MTDDEKRAEIRRYLAEHPEKVASMVGTFAQARNPGIVRRLLSRLFSRNTEELSPDAALAAAMLSSDPIAAGIAEGALAHRMAEIGNELGKKIEAAKKHPAG